MNGFTLDAGALVALDRDDRRVVSIIARAVERETRIIVPATALAQAMRSPLRQRRLSRLIRGQYTDVLPLDLAAATEVGILLARTATADVIDAHVLICAQRARQPIVTSDAGDLRRLDPDVDLISI